MKALLRTVRRCRPGLALVAGLTVLAVILGVSASPGDASPRPDPPSASEPRRIGMNSCAARGCHGGVDSNDPAHGRVYIKGGAYTTWLQDDPHAKAFEVLLEPRSMRIADKLKGPLGGKPAHEAGLCLSCHATVGPPESRTPSATPLRDGITCESCHGPAEVWQDKHLALDWRNQPASSKAIDGMTDLSTPAARASNCVGCHVGDRSRGMDMNHDLIAAGHPRLNFEFASYQASYPKHWKEGHEKTASTGSNAAVVGFEARSWAVGQVVTARAVLGLLEDRATASKEGAVKKAPAPEAVWPEFSEYECFSCHHGLTNPSPYQRPGHVLGRLAWETWPLAMLPDLAEGGMAVNWTDLQREMGRPGPDPDRVVRLSMEGRKQLDRLLEAVESEVFDANRVGSLLKRLTSRPVVLTEGWDRAAQHYLAVGALARAAKDLGLPVGPEVEAALREGAKTLDFPVDYDSPRNVSPSKPKPSSHPKF